MMKMRSAVVPSLNKSDLVHLCTEFPIVVLINILCQYYRITYMRIDQYFPCTSTALILCVFDDEMNFYA